MLSKRLSSPPSERVLQEFSMAKTSTRGSVGSKTATAKIHDQTMQRGEGGELHQIAEDDAPR